MNASFTIAQKAAGALAVLAIAACQPLGEASGPSTGPRIDPSKPVPVALLVPQGGDTAAIAQSLSNAAKMAAADLNGARIDLRIYDSGSSSASAAAAAQKAVDAGAKIIVGPLHAEAANGAGHAVADEGINVLAFSNNPAVAGGNVFVIGSTFENSAARLVSYAKRKGKTRIYLATGDDIAGRAAGAAVETAIARAGARLAGKQLYSRSVEGVNGAAKQISAATEAGATDALFLTADPYDALPFMLEALANEGVGPGKTQYMGLTRWDARPEIMGMPVVDNAWIALPDPATYGQFVARYQAAYGAKPHPLAGLGYDAISAIGASIARNKANAVTTGALTSGAGFAGVNGSFRLNADGTNTRALALGQIQGKQLIVIDPAPRGFGGFGF